MMSKGYCLFSAFLQKALEISRVHKSLDYSANLITLLISCPSLGFKNLLSTANTLHTLQTQDCVRQNNTGNKKQIPFSLYLLIV